MNSKIIITLFIAFIMITSVIGFMWGSGEDTGGSESLEYNNYQFKNINGKYLLELDNKQFIFDTSPYDLNNVDFEEFNLESDKYYIIFNPDEKDMNLEYPIQKLYLVLNSLGINIQLACSVEEGCDETLPIKDCSNYAFYFKRSGGGAKVYKEDNCVVIEGDNKGINDAVDKINLKLLNII